MCSPGGDPLRGRVSPFGDRRLEACTRLPDAFRSVPRPSSALVTQASPVRLLLLDLSCAEPVGFRVSFRCARYSILKVQGFRGFPPPPVGLTRLERVTFPLSEGCSNRLSYRPRQDFPVPLWFFFNF
jgi:hypothetical protein